MSGDVRSFSTITSDSLSINQSEEFPQFTGATSSEPNQTKSQTGVTINTLETTQMTTHSSPSGVTSNGKSEPLTDTTSASSSNLSVDSITSSPTNSNANTQSVQSSPSLNSSVTQTPYADSDSITSNTDQSLDSASMTFTTKAEPKPTPEPKSFSTITSVSLTINQSEESSQFSGATSSEPNQTKSQTGMTINTLETTQMTTHSSLSVVTSKGKSEPLSDSTSASPSNLSVDSITSSPTHSNASTQSVQSSPALNPSVTQTPYADSDSVTSNTDQSLDSSSMTFTTKTSPKPTGSSRSEHFQSNKPVNNITPSTANKPTIQDFKTTTEPETLAQSMLIPTFPPSTSKTDDPTISTSRGLIHSNSSNYRNSNDSSAGTGIYSTEVQVTATSMSEESGTPNVSTTESNSPAASDWFTTRSPFPPTEANISPLSSTVTPTDTLHSHPTITSDSDSTLTTVQTSSPTPTESLPTTMVSSSNPSNGVTLQTAASTTPKSAETTNPELHTILSKETSSLDHTTLPLSPTTIDTNAETSKLTSAEGSIHEKASTTLMEATSSEPNQTKSQSSVAINTLETNQLTTHLSLSGVTSNGKSEPLTDSTLVSSFNLSVDSITSSPTISTANAQSVQSSSVLNSSVTHTLNAVSDNITLNTDQILDSSSMTFTTKTEPKPTGSSSSEHFQSNAGNFLTSQSIKSSQTTFMSTDSSKELPNIPTETSIESPSNKPVNNITPSTANKPTIQDFKTTTEPETLAQSMLIPTFPPSTSKTDDPTISTSRGLIHSNSSNYRNSNDSSAGTGIYSTEVQVTATSMSEESGTPNVSTTESNSPAASDWFTTRSPFPPTEANISPLSSTVTPTDTLHSHPTITSDSDSTLTTVQTSSPTPTESMPTTMVSSSNPSNGVTLQTAASTTPKSAETTNPELHTILSKETSSLNHTTLPLSPTTIDTNAETSKLTSAEGSIHEKASTTLMEATSSEPNQTKSQSSVAINTLETNQLTTHLSLSGVTSNGKSEPLTDSTLVSSFNLSVDSITSSPTISTANAQSVQSSSVLNSSVTHTLNAVSDNITLNTDQILDSSSMTFTTKTEPKPTGSSSSEHFQSNAGNFLTSQSIKSSQTTFMSTDSSKELPNIPTETSIESPVNNNTSSTANKPTIQDFETTTELITLDQSILITTFTPSTSETDDPTISTSTSLITSDSSIYRNSADSSAGTGIYSTEVQVTATSMSGDVRSFSTITSDSLSINQSEEFPQFTGATSSEPNQTKSQTGMTINTLETTQMTTHSSLSVVTSKGKSEPLSDSTSASPSNLSVDSITSSPTNSNANTKSVQSSPALNPSVTQTPNADSDSITSNTDQSLESSSMTFTTKTSPKPTGSSSSAHFQSNKPVNNITPSTANKPTIQDFETTTKPDTLAQSMLIPTVPPSTSETNDPTISTSRRLIHSNSSINRNSNDSSAGTGIYSTGVQVTATSMSEESGTPNVSTTESNSPAATDWVTTRSPFPPTEVNILPLSSTVTPTDTLHSHPTITSDLDSTLTTVQTSSPTPTESLPTTMVSSSNPSNGVTLQTPASTSPKIAVTTNPDLHIISSKETASLDHTTLPLSPTTIDSNAETIKLTSAEGSIHEKASTTLMEATSSEPNQTKSQTGVTINTLETTQMTTHSSPSGVTSNGKSEPLTDSTSASSTNLSVDSVTSSPTNSSANTQSVQSSSRSEHFQSNKPVNNITPSTANKPTIQDFKTTTEPETLAQSMLIPTFPPSTNSGFSATVHSIDSVPLHLPQTTNGLHNLSSPSFQLLTVSPTPPIVEEKSSHTTKAMLTQLTTSASVSSNYPTTTSEESKNNTEASTIVPSSPPSSSSSNSTDTFDKPMISVDNISVSQRTTDKNVSTLTTMSTSESAFHKTNATNTPSLTCTYLNVASIQTNDTELKTTTTPDPETEIPDIQTSSFIPVSQQISTDSSPETANSYSAPHAYSSVSLVDTTSFMPQTDSMASGLAKSQSSTLSLQKTGVTPSDALADSTRPSSTQVHTTPSPTLQTSTGEVTQVSPLTEVSTLSQVPLHTNPQTDVYLSTQTLSLPTHLNTPPHSGNPTEDEETVPTTISSQTDIKKEITKVTVEILNPTTKSVQPLLSMTALSGMTAPATTESDSGSAQADKSDAVLAASTGTTKIQKTPETALSKTSSSLYRSEPETQPIPDPVSSGAQVFVSEDDKIPVFRAIHFDHPVIESGTFLSVKFHNWTAN
ncbi:mucin-3A-like [Astyanax mexicanus]|uniref:Mucin-3A-like n=1 Tax=Astyanax mexicanus TaxID=7994 RepID=A0A8T2KKD8_ASTMX|nr:mucin-3A-like [Astyanax mexicanus]